MKITQVVLCTAAVAMAADAKFSLRAEEEHKEEMADKPEGYAPEYNYKDETF